MYLHLRKFNFFFLSGIPMWILLEKLKIHSEGHKHTFILFFWNAWRFWASVVTWWSSATQQTKRTLTWPFVTHRPWGGASRPEGIPSGGLHNASRDNLSSRSCVRRQAGHSGTARGNLIFRLIVLFFKCQVLPTECFHLAHFPFLLLFLGIKLGFGSLLPLLIVLPAPFMAIPTGHCTELRVLTNPQ